MKHFIVAVDACDKNNTYINPIATPEHKLISTPKINNLCDTSTYDKLLKEINSSSITEEEKQFLRLAAGRHIIFNYELIEELYVKASKEMQQLLKSNALVLLDIEDAIKDGYLKMNKHDGGLI